MKILLAHQSSDVRSKASSGQRLVNLYAEPNPEGAKYPFTLYGTPGLSEWADTASRTAIQGAQVMGGLLYVISGNTVYKITEAGVVSTVGSITGTQRQVDLSNNGTQMTAITYDEDAFVITSSSVAAISSGLPANVTSSCFLDGYTVFSKASTGVFTISSAYDSTTIDALDVATAEESPDNLRRVTAFNSSLWLFGETSYEVYYNSGNADFPFEQISGAVNTSRGCLAKGSVAQEDNTLFFLGDDRIVYRVQGYTPQRVSTFAVENAFNEYTTLTDAFAFIYTQAGHKFYVITFPSENATWVLDIATGMWHERESFGLGRWRINGHVNFAGKNLVFDYTNGKIYELKLDVYTDNGEVIKRTAEGSVIWVDEQRLTYDSVRLDIDAGVGLATGQGSDPMVIITYSDDGKKTWSNERWVPIGKIGEYKNRAITKRLGQARERIFRFEITDPIKVNITGAYANVRANK